ncbi:MAG: DnaJ domain-containing protein [SAR324 cluster bacterium]|nr:DnaJ domain-containing protein [SAR324 cluster bacterium]MBL7035811.1 DnaJ domain-containing protein [SAR324 cluster bacterium]
MEQQLLNPYSELGVKPGVSPQQLKQAYRQSVMRYHPDRASGSRNAAKFRQVTEAYQLLQKMTAYENTTVRKNTAQRASHLRQKFSSVFFNQKKQQTQTSTAWWEKTEFAQKRAEKIKVNRQTTNLSLEELINCVELAGNQYVYQVALEAIAAKKDEGGVNYLLHLLQNSDPSKRTQVIQALGQCGFQRVNEYLSAYVMDPSIEISTAAIKALERINTSNRTLIIGLLRKENISWQQTIVPSLAKLKNKVFSSKSSKRRLGGLLLSAHKITGEQLEIALLMQKRFPLLLGQILRHLEYVSIPEIQEVVASQKKFS